MTVRGSSHQRYWAKLFGATLDISSVVIHEKAGMMRAPPAHNATTWFVSSRMTSPFVKESANCLFSSSHTILQEPCIERLNPQAVGAGPVYANKIGKTGSRPDMFSLHNRHACVVYRSENGFDPHTASSKRGELKTSVGTQDETTDPPPYHLSRFTMSHQVPPTSASAGAAVLTYHWVVITSLFRHLPRPFHQNATQTYPDNKSG